MNCYICGGNKISKVSGKVRDNDKLEILKCDWCGLKFLSNYPSFDHIGNSFYESSQMRKEDKEKEITEMLEAAKEDDDRRYALLEDEIKGKFILDFGCGAGGFLMNIQKNDYRGSSLSVCGIEPERRVREYLAEKGYNVFESYEIALEGHQKIGLSFDYITLFHTLEHLARPRETLKQLKTLLSPGGKIVIEVPHADDALLETYECKAFSDFTYWSCHLFLFNENSFDYLSKELGMKMSCKYIQRYSLSNHVWWMTKGRPGGHKEMTFLNDERLMEEYERVLAENEVTDTIWVELENV